MVLPRMLGREPVMAIVSRSITCVRAKFSLARSCAEAGSGTASIAMATHAFATRRSVARINGLSNLVKVASPGVQADHQLPQPDAYRAPLRHRIIGFVAGEQGVVPLL